MPLIIYVDNDNTLSLWVREDLDLTDLSGATAAYTLEDADGATVHSGSLTYDEIDTSNGLTYYIFRDIIPYTVSLTNGASYILDVSFNGGVNMIANWRNVPVNAETRTG